MQRERAKEIEGVGEREEEQETLAICALIRKAGQLRGYSYCEHTYVCVYVCVFSLQLTNVTNFPPTKQWKITLVYTVQTSGNRTFFLRNYYAIYFYCFCICI